MLADRADEIAELAPRAVDADTEVAEQLALATENDFVGDRSLEAAGQTSRRSLGSGSGKRSAHKTGCKVGLTRVGLVVVVEVVEVISNL